MKFENYCENEVALLAGLNSLLKNCPGAPISNSFEHRAGAGYSVIRPARVAQLDRASASGAKGCGFNSRRAHHFQIRPIIISELFTPPAFQS
jgi:hypothetical protein